MPRIEKSELVAAVLCRLDKPENWTQGVSARDRNGNATSLQGPAVSWCLSGAMTRELLDRGFDWDHLTWALTHDIADVFCEQYPELCCDSYMILFNDDPYMTHEGVKLVLEKVHAKLIERGE
jgi:hypothetical protein